LGRTKAPPSTGLSGPIEVDVLHDWDGTPPTSATGTGWQRTPRHVTRRTPWLRINRVLRVMLHTRWSAEAWAVVRVEFRRAVALRSEIRRAGWFN
ncbi:MAG TPA: hypothetical protein VFE97_15540, partial [Methylomirabilota bacterium]|nr:hypothetical protein [Methylomirabilota bacterium]